MRIAFYTNYSSIKAGGIFTYSIGVLKLLIETDHISEILLVCHADQIKYFKRIAESSKVTIVEIDRNKAVTQVSYFIASFLFETYFLYKEHIKSNVLKSLLLKFSNLINPYYRIIKNYGPELLYFPFQYAQVYPKDLPVITTMHDVQELHFPEFFTSKERLHRAINTAKAISESTSVIVSFNHVKKDLIKYFDKSEENIKVCLPPLTESWFSDVEQTETSKLQEEFGLPNKFILYPAATWIHKNHSVLFRALEHLKSKGMEIPLICTGNKTDYFKILCKEMESMDIKSQVKFLGLVSEADLIGLYKMASLVVIPTLYEAGSGPLFEAMRYRVPVICARTTSLPETIANDEFVFDPKDSERLAQLIEKGLFDAGFINENLNNSRTRIEYYSKFDYKKSFIDTFNQTISDF